MIPRGIEHDDPRTVVIIDIDDTLIDIGERRVELFRRHFPDSRTDAEKMRYDVGLRHIGIRTSAPARAYLADFAKPSVIGSVPVTEVEGGSAAVSALEAAGLGVILLTSRPSSMRDLTLTDLASVGLEWQDKTLVMCDLPETIDPADDSALVDFKVMQLRGIKREVEAIACVGNASSDVLAAFAAEIPAILLCTPESEQSTIDLGKHSHVGFQKCQTWPQVLVEIGTLRVGERTLGALRDSFSQAYIDWLSNLNNLCAIDVAVASVLAAVAGGGLLQESLPLASRLLALVPLTLALLALVFAIRSFTSKYSSGVSASRAIVPRFRQAMAILFDVGGPLTKARPGDAIYEYVTLRNKDVAEQASAHRKFFLSRYRTNNPQALLNLRMFETRSLNYVRAYAEHLSSQMLIWAATALAIWIIGVSFLDSPKPSQVVPLRSADSNAAAVSAPTTPVGPRGDSANPIKADSSPVRR